MTFNLPVLDHVYKIGESAYVTPIYSSDIVSSETTISCPEIITEVYNTLDKSTIDPDVFTFSSDGLITNPSNNSKAGIYDLTLRAYYTGKTNYATLDF